MNAAGRLAIGAALLAGAGCGGGGSSGPVTGAVRGVVEDTAGTALEQVTVQLRNPGTTTVIRSVATNAMGMYTVVGVAAGTYDAFVMLPPAMQVAGLNPKAVIVTSGDTASTDFSLEYVAVSFGTHVGPLLNASCAAGGCHGMTSPQQGMNLTTGNAYANTVDVLAMQPDSMDRIEPNDPDASYLIHKLQNTQLSVGGSGVRMPQGAPALPLQTVRMLRRWVSEGAQNN